MTEWKEWNGSPEQIAEMENTKHGYVVRRESGEEVCFLSIEYKCRYEDVVSYWIIPDDPLREMKIRQAITGQPVWVKVDKDSCGNKINMIYETTTPDWDIPNSEYRFTEFKEEL